MKRSGLWLPAVSLVLPLAVSAQMGRGMSPGSSGPVRGTPAIHGSPTFRPAPGTAVAVHHAPFAIPPTQQPFINGGIFGHPIGTNPNVFGHPIGTSPFFFNNGFNNGRFRHHHGFGNGVLGAFPYYPLYPYYPFGWDYMNYQPSPQDYNGTPNVVYVVPESAYTQPQPQPAAPAPAPTDTADATPPHTTPPEEVEPTMLVFRDGHRKEISNYAIMGSTLFVFTTPRTKIAMADLDIPATVRANEDRGVSFHVPETLGH